jgi:hypothetical protein
VRRDELRERLVALIAIAAVMNTVSASRHTIGTLRRWLAT